MWYEIDAVDRIAQVSPDWDQSAERNGARGIRAKAIKGRAIWGFLEGQAAQDHYAFLFESVRQTGRTARLRLRDDGPSRQSLLQLVIQRIPRQRLRIETRVLRERAVHKCNFLDRNAPRGPGLLRCCSWCKSVEVEHSWMGLHAAEKFMPDLGATCPPAALHDICPGCASTLRQERRAVLSCEPEVM